MIRPRPRTRPRFFVPDVVQTSAMDCGPAVLKCLLEGFGIPTHYDRLREACQTDVDGTSIDVLEEVALQLGLNAEQVMLPLNHLLLSESQALPAILVVRQPNGLTHFVLLWRRHGPFVQIMDPAVGRRWTTCRQLLDEVYLHDHPIPAGYWHSWATSAGFLGPLRRRLDHLGCRREDALLEEAVGAGEWSAMARLDAGVRFVEALVDSGGVRRGREARGVLGSLLREASGGPAEALSLIPEAFWFARPALKKDGADGEEHVLIRGAVLVRVQGGGAAAPADKEESPAAPGEPVSLSPDLQAAVTQPESRPLRVVLGLLRGNGTLFFVLLGVMLALAALGTVAEAVLLRGLFEIGRDLALAEQRLLAVGVLLLFALLLTGLEFGAFSRLAHLARRLEVRLRMTFLERLPRIEDRYFQSRPVSDMAERNHSLHQVRQLPRLGGRILHLSLMILFTAGAIAWLDPASAPLAVAAALFAISVPLGFQPALRSRDLRVRTHAGALSRFYLDALLGLTAIRAHAGERAVYAEHESLLVEWARASHRFLSLVVVVEAIQISVGFALAGGLLGLHAGRAADAGAVLLLAYWTLHLPVLGQELSLLARQFPTYRNITLRLLDPLRAGGEAGKEPGLSTEQPARPQGGAAGTGGKPRPGLSLAFENVTVRAGGHCILQDINLEIEPGSRVAVVGASGAGKSSLMGLLLGWHRPAAGTVRVDGEILSGDRLDRLRGETAWVDPGVQLWNRSLLDNLLYGVHDAPGLALDEVLRNADLHEVLHQLSEGLQTNLGEGGGLLSGGQGQRVRLGRGLARTGARLLLFDEPFRGLDRDKRRLLLERIREGIGPATFLCVTHDVGETLDFDRVLVLDGGRVVEDGCPRHLAGHSGSRYRALLEAEAEVRRGMWSGRFWRRLRLHGGRLREVE